MEKNQKASNCNVFNGAIEERIKNYVEKALKGNIFTVDDVCNSVGYYNKGHVDNFLCGVGFRTKKIEREGNYFTKKEYNDNELKIMVKGHIYRHGSLQLDIYLEGLGDVKGLTPAEKIKIEKILEKGCTNDGWVKRHSVYFR